MLASFKVSNFLSFKKMQEISFESSECKSHPEHVVWMDNIGILKKVMVFGPNGSGKSNIIYALAFMFEKMGLNDHGLQTFFKETEKHRYLDRETTAPMPGPSYFSICIKDETKSFDYSFEYDFNNKSVVSEKIKYSNGTTILDRKFDRYSTLSTSNSTVDPKYISELLVKVALFDHTIKDYYAIAGIRVSLSGLVIGSYDYEYNVAGSMRTENMYLCDMSCLDFLKQCLSELTDIEDIKQIDTGISLPDGKFNNPAFVVNGEQLLVLWMKTAKEIQFKERGFKRLRRYSELSSGVKRIVGIVLIAFSTEFSMKTLSNQTYNSYKQAGIINYFPDLSLEKIMNQATMFVAIDEFCYSLHPKIAHRLVDMLLNIPGNSFKNIQFLFTAHNTELMSTKVARIDEIYLIQASHEGSELCRLSDYEYTDRFDEGTMTIELNQCYLEDRFGAVPHFKNTRNANDL